MKSRPLTRRVRIRGAWWRIKVANPPEEPDALGLCCYDTKTIWVRPGVDLVETLIHEATHAASPDLDESAVEYIEQAVMNSLMVMGCLQPIDVDRAVPTPANVSKKR